MGLPRAAQETCWRKAWKANHPKQSVGQVHSEAQERSQPGHAQCLIHLNSLQLHKAMITRPRPEAVFSNFSNSVPLLAPGAFQCRIGRIGRMMNDQRCQLGQNQIWSWQISKNSPHGKRFCLLRSSWAHRWQFHFERTISLKRTRRITALTACLEVQKHGQVHSLGCLTVQQR